MVPLCVGGGGEGRERAGGGGALTLRGHRTQTNRGGGGSEEGFSIFAFCSGTESTAQAWLPRSQARSLQAETSRSSRMPTEGEVLGGRGRRPPRVWGCMCCCLRSPFSCVLCGGPQRNSGELGAPSPACTGLACHLRPVTLGRSACVSASVSCWVKRVVRGPPYRRLR